MVINCTVVIDNTFITLYVQIFCLYFGLFCVIYVFYSFICLDLLLPHNCLSLILLYLFFYYIQVCFSDIN